MSALGKLISACYLAETAERTKHWEENDGNPNPNSGKEKWLSPTYYNDVIENSEWKNSSLPKPSQGNFRAGKSENLAFQVQRCGPPHDKLNEMIRPVVGLDKTEVPLGHLASGTRVSYWGAWNRRLEFCKERGHEEWIDPREGGQWGENFLEFFAFPFKGDESQGDHIENENSCRLLLSCDKWGNRISPMGEIGSKP